MLTLEDQSKIVFKDLPLLDICEGNYQDTYFTLKLFNKFKEELEFLGTWKLYETCFVELKPICVDIELNGLIVDPNELSAVESQLDTLLAKASEELEEELRGYKINIRSPKDMQKLFYTDEAGLQLYPPVRSKKTGDPSCGKDALDIIERLIEETIETKKD